MAFIIQKLKPARAKKKIFVSPRALMNKGKELKKLEVEVVKCKICPIGKSGKMVFGEGSPNAKIAFIGEAPGRKEAETGRPFVGRSGQLLRSQVRSIGLSEDEVYITSPVKYLPDRGTPSKQDIAHGKVHLDRQLEIIKPKIVVVMGSTAAKALIDGPIFVAKQHGTIVQQNKVKYFLMYHPAAAIRFQKLRKVFEEDFQKLKQLISEEL